MPTQNIKTITRQHTFQEFRLLPEYETTENPHQQTHAADFAGQARRRALLVLLEGLLVAGNICARTPRRKKKQAMCLGDLGNVFVGGWLAGCPLFRFKLPQRNSYAV